MADPFPETPECKGFQPLTGHLPACLLAVPFCTPLELLGPWALRTHTDSGRSLLTLVERMQKSSHMDWLLFGSLTLLAISILGFAYILWQTYITVSR